MISNIPNVWIVVGAGVILWVISLKIGGYRPGIGKPSGFSRLLSIVGVCIFGLGMYAGFRGPLTLGSITLEKFSFADILQKRSEEALRYAQSSLDLSRQPAVGWGGASKTTLQYSVRNKGDREISGLVVRLSTTEGSYVDLSVDGPFPAGKTSTSIVNVPANVSRSYFSGSSAGAGEIVGASF